MTLVLKALLFLQKMKTTVSEMPSFHYSYAQYVRQQGNAVNFYK